MSKNWMYKETDGSAKIVDGDNGGTIATVIRTSKGAPEEKRRNARLIVEAVNKHDDLVAKVRKLSNAIDAINTMSGRCSMGHGDECECGYCLIHRTAFNAWKHA